MLEQQFLTHPGYRRYLSHYFILYHADSSTAPGKALFTRFDVNASPCLLLATADGSEVDRIIGYEVPAVEYKEAVERLRRGENTIKAVLAQFNSDPGSLKLAAKLARRYQERFEFSKMRSFSRLILLRPEEAARVIVPFGKDDAAVSAYEYARYTSAFDGPAQIPAFLSEFPASPMRDAALGNLSWFLSNRTEKQPVLVAYEILLKRYPTDPGLLAPLINHFESTSTQLDRAIRFAESIERLHPERLDHALRRSYAALLMKAGNEEKARDIFGDSYITPLFQSLDHRPLNDYAWFWALQGRNLDSAMAAARQAVKLKDAANVWDTLSMVYRKLNRLEEALEAEERAVKLSNKSVKRYVERVEEIRQEMRKR